MATESKNVKVKVETNVKKLRAFFAQSPMPSISTLQQNSLREKPAPNSAWISRITLPSPEDTVRTVLFQTIQALSSDGLVTPELPSLVPIEAEWTGYRGAIIAATSEDPLSEKDNYINLMKEITSNLTLLYVHGGGF